MLLEAMGLGSPEDLAQESQEMGAWVLESPNMRAWVLENLDMGAWVLENLDMGAWVPENLVQDMAGMTRMTCAVLSSM